MREFRIRCSSLGKIMTEPTAAAKARGEVLSVGAKTHVRELARSTIFGVERQLSSKVIEKGIRCEEESIALFNSVFFKSLTKNTERRTEGDLTGECDLLDTDEGIDIKTSWSIDTFPLLVVDCVDPIYEWQARGYMRLFDRPRWRIAYCLVDTPEDLIGFEAEESHIVGHIAEELRVTTWVIERDLELEAAMLDRIKHARRYFGEVIAEFDATHGGEELAAEPPPWGDAKSPPKPLPVDFDAITF